MDMIKFTIRDDPGSSSPFGTITLSIDDSHLNEDGQGQWTLLCDFEWVLDTPAKLALWDGSTLSHAYIDDLELAIRVTGVDEDFGVIAPKLVITSTAGIVDLLKLAPVKKALKGLNIDTDVDDIVDQIETFDLGPYTFQ
eukprot:gnl/Dysnectes_brevis/1930_a2217_1545.p1 GENE.gnl/Dysnectes_brevis/1930_a2217_1545~~gnl/Dysnectes_brevis/1930_a2217_1545.p1  ORF type:complete len:139 (-),score=55.91 gnl/Dysnectes_brevis/1930_a2217_1545:41-457(-)